MAIKRNSGYEVLSLLKEQEREIALMEKGYLDWIGAKDKYSKEDIAKNPDAFAEPEGFKLLKKENSESLKIAKKEIEQKNFPLKAYESICINGGVLVDGNYLYLESLRAMSHFILDGDLNSPKLSKYLGVFLFSDDDEKNILNVLAKDSEALSNSISSIANGLFMMNTTNIYEEIIKKVYGVDKDIYMREELLNVIDEGSSRPKSSNTLFYDWSLDVNFFDAELPSNEKAINFVKRNSIKVNDETLRNLNLGLWQNYHEGENILVPYDLKNDYIKKIKKLMEGDLILGRKMLDLNKHGYGYVYEKEVDTKLTLKGVELADRDDLDFILLVTNDGDFAPLIEAMKGKKKKVFLYSPGDPKRISKYLIDAVGKNNCIGRDYVDSNDIRKKYGVALNDQPKLEKFGFAISVFLSLIFDPFGNQIFSDQFIAEFKDHFKYLKKYEEDLIKKYGEENNIKP